MKSFGVIDNPVDFTLGVYFHHCAVAMSCRQLAMAGRYLAHAGPSGQRIVCRFSRARATHQCANADLWPLRRFGRIRLSRWPAGQERGQQRLVRSPRVRRPSPSGRPGLDADGNSHLGQIALEMLAKRMGWSIFGTDNA